MSALSVVATGDSFITRRIVAGPQTEALAARLGGAEVCFTNFEMLTPCGEGFPNAESGGTWACGPAEVADDLRALGFNMVAWANNHTLDYSYGGLAATQRELARAGLVAAGVGATLAEAAAPRYLETPAGRVALIGACASFHGTDRAGNQRPDQRGRPGLNPLRHTSTWLLPREELASLAAMAAACGINARFETRVRAGFARPPEPGVVLFGEHRFREGPAGVHTEPHPGDLARLRTAIADARRQAEFVLVSLHAHEQRGGVLAEPAEFVETACRAFIEAGADAVIGHGPHVLRGIEIYQGRPIFYSLGNFFFQNETIENLPSDYFEALGLDLAASTADGLDARTANNTRGFITTPWAWKSVLARFTVEGGRLTGCELHPVDLSDAHRARRGTPRLSDEAAILDHLAELCAPYGTHLEIAGGMARIAL